MKTSEFDYRLPPGRIAQQPITPRDASRMLVLHRQGGLIEHRRFADLPAFLRRGDLLVLNDTRVFPARLWARKPRTGGKVEMLFLEEAEPNVWAVLLRASRRPRPGDRLELPAGAAAEVLANGELGRATVRVESARPLLELLEEHGLPPLPPYIKRPLSDRSDSSDVSDDRSRYQTIYASKSGAVAAPTAGLHFTDTMFAALERAGVGRCAVTLHVGPGTFRPVATENVEEHVMEAERYQIPEATARAIEDTRTAGGRIVAVGSTTVRTLETVAAERGRVAPCEGRSHLFIYPGFQPRIVNALLTNFHLPRSTLLMMVCALAGRDLIMQAYAEAIREEYRFYSYGDCMLIL